MFLSVITRCYKRPRMLVQNVASLKEQTSQDYEQLFIVDNRGNGIGWANRALATVSPNGDYVLVLDDDDRFINPQAIATLKEAAKDKPELIIFRAEHDGLGILPSPGVWGKRPILGQIGSISFITRRDIWQQRINAFGVDAAGDYEFLKAIWQEEPDVIWHDVLLTGTQRISRGKPE